MRTHQAIAPHGASVDARVQGHEGRPSMAFFKVQTIKTNVLGAINMRGLAKRLKCRISRWSACKVSGRNAMADGALSTAGEAGHVTAGKPGLLCRERSQELPLQHHSQVPGLTR